MYYFLLLSSNKIEHIIMFVCVVYLILQNITEIVERVKYSLCSELSIIKGIKTNNSSGNEQSNYRNVLSNYYQEVTSKIGEVSSS